MLRRSRNPGYRQRTNRVWRERHRSAVSLRCERRAPAPVTNIGAPLPFVPEGIDFRPSSSTLYAIDVGPNTVQLYTINILTGAPTAVGAGFNSTGPGYDLTTSSNFGFDFNPKTLQGDGSMRIRLVNTSNQNLRLNSSTGLVANVDTPLVIPPAQSPFVDAVAYINNKAEGAGPATTLFDMDSRNDSLYTQAPPNDGTLNLVGAVRRRGRCHHANSFRHLHGSRQR